MAAALASTAMDFLCWFWILSVRACDQLKIVGDDSQTAPTLHLIVVRISEQTTTK